MTKRIKSTIKKEIIFDSLIDLHEKSSELTTDHEIRMEGLISPEVYEHNNDAYIFNKNVKVFEDDDTFGNYCKFTIIIYVSGHTNNSYKIRINIEDSAGEKIMKRPLTYSHIPNNDEECVCFNWSGPSFYDCDRTYFHFGTDEKNKTGEGDFMHYKCKLTKRSIL